MSRIRIGRLAAAAALAVAAGPVGFTPADADSQGPALWVTAIAFGALLLVRAGWLWTRRGPYDPA